MAIELYCNHSAALSSLISADEVRIDGVELTPFHSLKEIQSLRASYPGLPFQFHASHLGKYTSSKRAMARLHRACPESRWISLHLSPLPPRIIFPALKFGIRTHVSAPERWLAPFIEQIKALKPKMDLPLILENMPALPALDTQIESDPETISRVLRETGCEMLLDLGHARIAAAHREMDVRAYLALLPLDSVRQIHISGIREKRGVYYDAHESLQEEDYHLLAWTLGVTHPQSITLEYYRENKSELKAMLLRLQTIIGQVSPHEGGQAIQ